MFIYLQDSRDWKFGACQKWEHVRLAIEVILGIFWFQAHTYYSTYDVFRIPLGNCELNAGLFFLF